MHRLLSDVRADAVADMPLQLCGWTVRHLTLRDVFWLDAAGCKYITGGTVTLADALKLLWYVHGWSARKAGLSRAILRRLMIRMTTMRMDATEIMQQVSSYVDRHFLDAPHRYVAPSNDGPSRLSTPYALPLGLAHDVMAAYPSYRYAELVELPLPHFWQVYHHACRALDPSYQHYCGMQAVRIKWREKYLADADKTQGPPPLS